MLYRYIVGTTSGNIPTAAELLLLQTNAHLAQLTRRYTTQNTAQTGSYSYTCGIDKDAVLDAGRHRFCSFSNCPGLKCQH